jgi:hypothetical protein
MKTQYPDQVISYSHSSTLDNPQVAKKLHHKYMLHKNTPRLFDNISSRNYDLSLTACKSTTKKKVS